MKKIRQTRPAWTVMPANCKDIANFKGTNGANSSFSVHQDGAFLLSVYTIPNQWLMEPMNDVVRQVVTCLGTPRSCKLIENGTNMSRYQVEYFNKRHAAYAFSCLGGFKLEVSFFFFLFFLSFFSFVFFESGMLTLGLCRVFVSMSLLMHRKRFLFCLIFELPALAPLRAPLRRITSCPRRTRSMRRSTFLRLLRKVRRAQSMLLISIESGKG